MFDKLLLASYIIGAFIKSVLAVAGGIYWIYIYATPNGRKKRDKIVKYTRIDRILHILFAPMTLAVCIFNFLIYGDVKIIE